MKELEECANYRNKLQIQMEIILSQPYKPLMYCKIGNILDSTYAGKAWNTLRNCLLYAELPDKNRN